MTKKSDAIIKKQTEWFRKGGYEWDGKFWVKIRKVATSKEES